MILRDNYTEQHIRELQAASKGDPSLIERTLFWKITIALSDRSFRSTCSRVMRL